MKVKYILIGIVFFAISSCGEWFDRFDTRQENAIGEYIVDINKGKDVINFYNGNKKLEDMYSIPDAPDEIKYYSDFKLIIHKNHTFEFTKPFFGEKKTIKGTWKFVSDFETPAYWIDLRSKKYKFYRQFPFDDYLTLLTIKNNKKLLLRKREPSTHQAKPPQKRSNPDSYREE